MQNLSMLLGKFVESNGKLYFLIELCYIKKFLVELMKYIWYNIYVLKGVI